MMLCFLPTQQQPSRAQLDIHLSCVPLPKQFAVSSHPLQLPLNPTAIKVQLLSQKVHLLEQHPEHKWPFSSCCQVPGWGYTNSFLQLHENHIWKWQAGTWLHGTLVTMCWCENTFQSMHLRQLLFLYCLKTNVLNEWLFFSLFPSLIMSRKVSTMDRDGFLMMGTPSASPTHPTRC